ncbi:gamma-glutamyltranspeptidase [Chaetomium sp. MPI-SDFR-AT-0129]|nr:gamma-glutamyltranspeptidase [Chaetomium sp. MPI-SDFR-AT-0129]
MRHSSLLPYWLTVLAQLTPGLASPVDQQRGGHKKYHPIPEGGHGAVASESSICSKIGIDLIAKGGSAADAMVGTTLCVGVIGMYHSGIGGGGFMLVRDRRGHYETINYRETAPAAAFQDMYAGNENGSVFGGLAVGVPGELKGLDHLHRKYGRLPWKDVVLPAVHVARDGFNVTEDLVRYMASATANGNTFLTDDPLWAQDFAPNGKLLELGEIITRKRYANTLEKIAHQGIDVFYKGELAKSMIDLIQSTNGTMTLEDLAGYNVDVQRALNVTYDKFRLFSTDAPSSGAITTSILKTLWQYGRKDLPDVNLTTQRFVEATKFAYGARLQFGDPVYTTNTTDLETYLLQDSTARDIRSRILDDRTQEVEAYNPLSLYMPESHGTSHIVTSDASGLTVSSTTTINLLFGAQIITPETGIILNNEMDDFSQPGKNNSFGYAPSPANFIAAGKRPLSSISPLIVEHACNGTLYFATGAAGGSRIITATTQVAWNILAYGTSLHDAIAHPRLHHQLLPDTLSVENGYDAGVVASLQAKGHEVAWIAPGQSSAQGLMRHWDGRFEAVGETRQVNSAGYTV